MTGGTPHIKKERAVTLPVKEIVHQGITYRVPFADLFRPLTGSEEAELRASVKDIEAEPDELSTAHLLAILVRDKFSATTLLRLIVANTPHELRDDAFTQLVRGALLALAEGDADEYERHLIDTQAYVRTALDDLGKAALDALMMTTGVADGTQPPMY